MTIVQHGAVAVITVDHPPANALDAATLSWLERMVDRAERDASVRAVVIRGAGERFFVAGADIREFVAADGQLQFAALHTGNELFNRIERLSKPVVAAINGMCFGGGCELAMACDLRVAGTNARFGQPEIKLGILPGWGGLQRLPRLIGRTRGLELLLTGDGINADMALSWGLVNRVVPDDRVQEEAIDLAERLTKLSMDAVRLTKQRVFDGASEPIATAISADERAFLEVFATPNAHEGITAFLAKRPAAFT